MAVARRRRGWWTREARACTPAQPVAGASDLGSDGDQAEGAGRGYGGAVDGHVTDVDDPPFWPRIGAVVNDSISHLPQDQPIGTNLIGLVKHVATVEARYFGEVFDRPSPEPLRRWQDSNGSDLWAAEDETRDQIIAFYRRTWEHSDATINELPLDAPGHVPWWPEPYADTNLFAIMVHVLGESIRHAGHADILREGLDGRTGLRANTRSRSTRKPVQPTARRSSRPPGRPHQSRHS